MATNEDTIWWVIAGALALFGVYSYIKPSSFTFNQPVASVHAPTDETTKTAVDSKPWGCVFIPPATAQTDWKYLSCQDRTDCESWCNSQTYGSVQQSNPLGASSTWNPTSPTALPSTAFVQAQALAVFR